MNTSKIKKVVKQLSIFWAIVFGLIILGNHFTGRMIEEKDRTDYVKKINSSLPIMLEGDIRMDRAEDDKGVIVYNFTLLNLASTSAQNERDQLQNKISSTVTKNVCADKNIIPSLRSGYQFRYAYFTSDSHLLFSILIGREECRL